MSDSTANAREPSMEDILASIRRIIDEEDGRDARPASDVEMDSVDADAEEDRGSLPVMAAASVDRDDDARGADDGGFFSRAADAALDDSESGSREGPADDGDAETIFPERESPFWSRATGRVNGSDDDEGHGDGEQASAEVSMPHAPDAKAPVGSRTDIFRRAQSKLGSATRPGTRERIQSLAARAEERAEHTVRDRASVAELAGLSERGDESHENDDGFVAGAMDRVRGEGEDGILDLTEPLDHVAEEGADRTAQAGFDGDRDDHDDGMDAGWAAAYEDASDKADDLSAPESLRGLYAVAADGQAEDREDDVLDLTVPADDAEHPVEQGSVENGDDFHVSETDEAVADDRDDAEETVSHAAAMDDEDRADAEDARPDTEDDGAHVEDARADADAEQDDTPANTYSRFDHEDHASVLPTHGDAPDDTSDDVDDAVTARDEPETLLRDDRDDPAHESASADDAAMDETTHEAESFYGTDTSDSEPVHESASTDADDTLQTLVTPSASYAEPDAPERETVFEDEATADRGMEEEASDDRADADAEPLREAETTYAEATDTEVSHAEPDDPADEPVRDDAPFSEPDAEASPDSYTAAFMMLDDEPPAGDRPGDDTEDRADADALDLGDDLGFSDTFGASDVYHDDPPELDADYSRSFEEADEPVAARAAFAGDAPEERKTSRDALRDDGMEKVGGLVRDALERDPVDYADPSALVSMTSEEISARALASLADVEGEASRRVFGSLRISDDDGSESLEGMVRGMLRPMLREWLDDNLPTMVETAVRGEVERISAKSRKYSRAADRD